MDKYDVVCIAGPTASGKSAAALAYASATGGEIVNADAMQVYRDLRIVTARPSREDEERVPHHLYGILDGSCAFSAGRWARMAAQAVSGIRDRGRVPVITGGSGLYFTALLDGLSPVPEIPAAIRRMALDRYRERGKAGFRREVLALDPGMERTADPQRLLRAYEVYKQTGKTLSYFRTLPRKPLIQGKVRKIVFDLPRRVLYERCNRRAEEIFDDEGIAEVRALLSRDPDSGMPVMKALGVREIRRFLCGEYTREQALSLLRQNTRRYAKRQMTWFRRQLPGRETVSEPEDGISGSVTLSGKKTGRNI